jgi:hypothetical protein
MLFQHVVILKSTVVFSIATVSFRKYFSEHLKFIFPSIMYIISCMSVIDVVYSHMQQGIFPHICISNHISAY